MNNTRGIKQAERACFGAAYTVSLLSAYSLLDDNNDRSSGNDDDGISGNDNDYNIDDGNDDGGGGCGHGHDDNIDGDNCSNDDGDNDNGDSNHPDDDVGRAAQAATGKATLAAAAVVDADTAEAAGAAAAEDTPVPTPYTPYCPRGSPPSRVVFAESIKGFDGSWALEALVHHLLLLPLGTHPPTTPNYHCGTVDAWQKEGR